jgi:hypothetical protein
MVRDRRSRPGRLRAARVRRRDQRVPDAARAQRILRRVSSSWHGSPAILTFRFKEAVSQFEVTLDAIPIVALVTFLIGVVFAYLLGVQAQRYGATIFVVDGVALALSRELAPILVAVIVAGRSGAAFTAQIGSMKVQEETDAIRTLGLSPIRCSSFQASSRSCSACRCSSTSATWRASSAAQPSPPRSSASRPRPSRPGSTRCSTPRT